MEWSKHARDDFIGGLVSAAVGIPLAMGYGMFALASLGENYFADGALAGLTTALVVAVACVALGDKTTTVYAPRVNSTFFLGLLIYGLVHSDAPEIAAGGAPLILTIAFSVVLLGGAFEALFGLARLGTLIKFAPQPVMAGFQNAAALLLFLVQLGNVCGFDHNVPFTQVPAHWAEIKPLSVLIAAITFAMMWNARKLLPPKVPPMLVGIILGCVLYYLCQLLGLGAHLGPVIADQPRAKIAQTVFSYFTEVKSVGDLLAFAPTIISGALALAMIASIDALLCTKLVTAPGEPRRDGDRILIRLGVGNLAAACFGGITGGINIGASITNRSFGARSGLSVLINGIALLIAIILLFRWLGDIPRVALSAVIMVIAVQHFDPWSLRLLGRMRDAPTSLRVSTAFDLLVVVVVAVLSIAVNIVSAVFIGLAISVVLFVFHMSRSIVRRSYRCDTVHSRKSRPALEHQFLERTGGAILVMELQGALFFGTGETMTKAIESEFAQGTSCVILDLRRLTEIDGTGINTLVELQANLGRQKIDLLLVAGPQSIAMQRLEEYGALTAFDQAHLFPDVDRSIERAEDDLLRAHEHAGAAEIELPHMALFAGFEPHQLAAITAIMERKTFDRRSVVFREGDPGDEVLVVTKGTASVYLQLPNGTNVRLATFAPGTVFGELAILDRGARAATVIADGELVCYGISRKDYAALAQNAPDAAIQFMAAIGRELSGRLRAANRTINQLEA